jgi:hypothetical protein
MNNQQMVESMQKILDARIAEKTASQGELNERMKGKKGHEDALKNYKKELENLTADFKASIENLQKKIDKLEDEYEKVMTPHNTAIKRLDDLKRTIDSHDYHIDNLTRHLEVLKHQAEGWIIFSFDKSWHGVHLGEFDKNNYRPGGWFIMDIIAKPNGIYVKSSIGSTYRKVSDPGRNEVEMVKPEDLVKAKKNDRDGNNFEVVTEHTCKKPIIIKKN